MKRGWRRVRRVVAVGAVVFVVVVVFFVAAGWRAFGHRASGARLARMQASPQWRDGHFANPQPMFMDPETVTAMFGASPVAAPEPTKPVPAAQTSASSWATPPTSGLRVTWFGHASTLVEIDGQRILTDPAFGPRASPFDFVGPSRWYPPVDVHDLGPVDAVVISHDHHDHLQYSSVLLLNDLRDRRGEPLTWFVPLGIGAHLEYWGVDPARIVELDWWEHRGLPGDGADRGAVEVHCLPARHASGRQLLDQGATLWSSWAFVGADVVRTDVVGAGVGAGVGAVDRAVNSAAQPATTGHRVFFSGDTGLHEAMGTIGEKLGPFDLTMIEVGQYHPTWPDWHIGPEQAVKAHRLLRGRLMLPVHWALWTLAPHGWTEPGERTLAAAAAADVALALPLPGQPFEPTSASSATTTAMARWWPEEPWTPGAEQPIVSTVAGDPAVRMP